MGPQRGGLRGAHPPPGILAAATTAPSCQQGGSRDASHATAAPSCQRCQRGGRDGRAPEPCHHSPKGRYPAPQGKFLRFQGLFCCSPKGPFPGPARCRRATAAGADGGNDGDGADGGCRGLRERPSGGGAPTRRGRWGRRSLQARSGGARGSRWGGDGDGGVTIPNPDCEPLIPNP